MLPLSSGSVGQSNWGLTLAPQQLFNATFSMCMHCCMLRGIAAQQPQQPGPRPAMMSAADASSSRWNRKEAAVSVVRGTWARGGA